jgi:hypothetical protein
VDFSHLDRRSYWAQIDVKSGQMPPGAILICDWPEANEAKYLQSAEGWRPDLRATIADTLLGGDGQQIDRWLAEGRPLFMLGNPASLLSRYSAARDGPLWKITGRQAESAAPPMTHQVNRRYGSSILLVGYTLQPDAPDSLRAGDLLHLTLYWKAAQPISERYVVFNHLIDAQGGKVAQQDGEPGGGTAPTVDWKPGTVITDSFSLPIAPQTAPGTYRLMTGLYTRLGEHRLPAFTEDGTSLGNYPELASITIK